MRLTQAERAELEKAAKLAGLSLSEWMRKWLLASAQKRVKRAARP